MSEAIASSSSIAAVPEDVHQVLLIDGTEVKSKLGHVAKFQPTGEGKHYDHDQEQPIEINEFRGYTTAKTNDQFVGLTKEELKSYINDPKWKRTRWIISILYLVTIVLLLIGSVYLVLTSPRCPPKPNLVWYEREVIYEIDLPTFRDSNQDGVGDLAGLTEKLKYLEDNRMRSILLQSSIFNSTLGTSIQLDGTAPSDKKMDLLEIDPSIGNDNQLQNLTKVLNRKNMHLILDLPISSTADPNGVSWYGSSERLTDKVKNPCIRDESNLGCQYYKSYGRLPLDFNNEEIAKQAKFRLTHWLETKKVDGARVDLPLQLNSSSALYEVSYETLESWDELKKGIEKKSKAKLLLIDIPAGLNSIIKSDVLQGKTSHSLLLSKTNAVSPIRATQLNERMEAFESDNLNKPKFWKLGSKRRGDDAGVLTDQQLPKEILLTTVMLLGGTPILLSGDELGLDQKSYSLMPWSGDGEYGGFSSCTSNECARFLASAKKTLAKTSVKRQEALGGSKASVLSLYRHLAALREQESFQFGQSVTGADPSSNLFWFIREASGYRGYVVLFNLNQKGEGEAHISLHELTARVVPEHVHYEYQWPEVHFPTSNTTYIHTDNLVVHPGSITIFWWKPKLIKPKNLFSKAVQHSDDD